jgi:hypothetical protein
VASAEKTERKRCWMEKSKEIKIILQRAQMFFLQESYMHQEIDEFVNVKLVFC